MLRKLIDEKKLPEKNLLLVREEVEPFKIVLEESDVRLFIKDIARYAIDEAAELRLKGEAQQANAILASLTKLNAVREDKIWQSATRSRTVAPMEKDYMLAALQDHATAHAIELQTLKLMKLISGTKIDIGKDVQKILEAADSQKEAKNYSPSSAILVKFSHDLFSMLADYKKSKSTFSRTTKLFDERIAKFEELVKQHCSKPNYSNFEVKAVIGGMIEMLSEDHRRLEEKHKGDSSSKFAGHIQELLKKYPEFTVALKKQQEEKVTATSVTAAAPATKTATATAAAGSHSVGSPDDKHSHGSQGMRYK
jgi:hypothetical protein